MSLYANDSENSRMKPEFDICKQVQYTSVEEEARDHDETNPNDALYQQFYIQFGDDGSLLTDGEQVMLVEVETDSLSPVEVVSNSAVEPVTVERVPGSNRPEIVHIKAEDISQEPAIQISLSPGDDQAALLPDSILEKTKGEPYVTTQSIKVKTEDTVKPCAAGVLAEAENESAVASIIDVKIDPEDADTVVPEVQYQLPPSDFRSYSDAITSSNEQLVYTTLNNVAPPFPDSAENAVYVHSAKDVFALPQLPQLHHAPRNATPPNRYPGTPYPHGLIARCNVVRQPTRWPSRRMQFTSPPAQQAHATYPTTSQSVNMLYDRSEDTSSGTSSSFTSNTTPSSFESNSNDFSETPSNDSSEISTSFSSSSSSGGSGSNVRRIIGPHGQPITHYEDSSGIIRYIIPMSNERENHNIKERKRRGRVATACTSMREMVPGISDKTDKATVFEKTVDYLSFMKRKVGTQYDQDYMAWLYNCTS